MKGKDKKKAPLAAIVIGTGFGTGYCPIAPGTAGALLALGIWMLAAKFLSQETLTWTLTGLLTICMSAGTWAAGKLEKHWGKDPSRVTIDELAGMWMALLPVTRGDWVSGLAAFTIFRLLDIFKPLGIREMEKLKGGWGIMTDDLLAGLYSALLIILTRNFLI